MQLKLLVKCDDRQERTCLDTDTLHKPEANSREMRKGRSSLSVSRPATQNHVLRWLNISQTVECQKKMSKKSSLVDLFCTPFLPDSPCIPIQQFNMVVNSSCRHRTAYHILCICSALRVLHMPGESVDALKMHHCNRDQLIISYYTYRETNKLFCLQNCNETPNLIKVKTFLVISAI